MKPGVAVFRTPHHVYYADTCEDLKAAAQRGELGFSARARGRYPGQPLPNDAMLELRSVGYWDADHDQSWGLPWHRNEGIELTYLARGKLEFAVDDQTYLLRSGDLTVTRPWQLHRLGSPHVTACRLHWLILDVGVRRPNQTWRWPSWLVLSAADRANLTANLSHNEQPVWRAEDEVAHYFERLAAAADTYEEPTGESRVKLYINGLLVALADLLRRQQPPLDPSLSSTQRTVELFLGSLGDHAEQEWSVDAMAAACGLGRSRFTYYCKQMTNMSPTEYLSHCRVTSASRLLRARRDLSVTDVALQVGFGSSQYFATVFRQHVGCSPREFRRHPNA